MDGILPSNVSRGDARAYAGATGRDLHIDVPLSNISINYEPQGLIAPLIYPVVNVDKETGVYYVWSKAENMRVHNAVRARGMEANRIAMDVSSDTYSIRNYALAMDIPYEDLENADASLNIRESATRRVVSGLNLAWEDREAVTLTTTTNMTSSTALANAWSDADNSTPVDDIYTGVNAIRRASGYMPNVAIFSHPSWINFMRHPDVIDFIRGKGDNVGGGGVTESQVANVFGFDRILVGRGQKTTTAEGAGTATYADIWSTSCVMLYVNPTPGLLEPSHGYTFRWTPAGFPGALAAERYDNRRPKTESIEVHMFQDEKTVGPDLGYLIVGC
jgi:hypothetical protein